MLSSNIRRTSIMYMTVFTTIMFVTWCVIEHTDARSRSGGRSFSSSRSYSSPTKSYSVSNSSTSKTTTRQKHRPSVKATKYTKSQRVDRTILKKGNHLVIPSTKKDSVHHVGKNSGHGMFSMFNMMGALILFDALTGDEIPYEPGIHQLKDGGRYEVEKDYDVNYYAPGSKDKVEIVDFDDDEDWLIGDNYDNAVALPSLQQPRPNMLASILYAMAVSFLFGLLWFFWLKSRK